MRNEEEVSTAHKLMVSKLIKSPTAIYQELNGQKISALHAAVGISGEAGELLDAIKKFAIYDKIPDRDNIVEELGDIEFYMQALRIEFQIFREETLRANIEKLAKRYPGFNYTNEAAHRRADKEAE